MSLFIGENVMIKNISRNKVFNGWHQQFSHYSTSLNCDMRFAIFLPPQAETQKVPVLYWLSGLTCTDENFMQKAGALGIAAKLGMAIVAPDTSPRGEQVPDDPNGDYDFGLGAGFYLNATQTPWKTHYQMYDYIVHELPTIIASNFPITNKRAISGHSMGGHGALMIALKNPQDFASVSAFSPISHPINCAWGQKAFSGYLGSNRDNWKQYDSCELLAVATDFVPALVDQGLDDEFYHKGQLQTSSLIDAAKLNNYPIEIRLQEGYDHSYYFISTFIEDHLRFHWHHLTA